MKSKGTEGWRRREFLSGMSLMGTAGLVGLAPRVVAADPPPETTRLRLNWVRGTCWAPLYVAEELLRAEGFTEVQYVRRLDFYRALGAGDSDISMGFVGPLLIEVDAGQPIVMLAGVHVGCFELFGRGRVRSIGDLKGKTVAVPALGGPAHVFLSSMAAHAGLDPRTDITWVIHPGPEAMRLFAEGKLDAHIAFPPDAQELREKKIGRVVVNSAADRPWSQYFCCVAATNREFVRRHPVATKRALRAVLKAANICALEPERAARLLVDRNFTRRYDYALQTMKGIPWNRWRDYDPEDTVRFYALRLRELGMIKSSPQEIMERGTDWRFLNELKKELKG